jgi:hypothetical protein
MISRTIINDEGLKSQRLLSVIKKGPQKKRVTTPYRAEEVSFFRRLMCGLVVSAQSARRAIKTLHEPAERCKASGCFLILNSLPSAETNLLDLEYL